MTSSFSADKPLADMGLYSCIGVLASTLDSRALGLIAVLFRNPIDGSQMAETLLPLHASRVAAELERTQVQEAMMEPLEKARYASRAKSEFLANMSHEL